MPSTVDIANYALNNLGASNISSLDENSKAARVVNQRYDAVRDAVFRAHPWNCLIERRKLLTDEAVARIKYIGRITDPQQYDASLVEALAARLAAEVCYAITGSTSMVQIQTSLYEAKINEARFNDATEGATQRLEASDFIESRF
jgi:hypothetical protein